jgi:hypothetical protein
MDDIGAIIDTAKHFKYHEPAGTTPFNRLSSLPETKRRMKQAIKERMRFLAEAYVSIASFIDDDLVDFLENADVSKDKEKIKKIYLDVIEDMEKLRKEMENFRHTELPTSGV